MLADPALDAEINQIAELPAEEAAARWSALDRKIMEQYLPALPRFYDKTAVVVGTNVGGATVDVTMGLPHFLDMYLKS
jgi:peptide/nickel transport system substrate-binding protein